MSAYPYKFDSSSKKFICPNCGKRRFVKYIDTKTGEYLPNQYGKCDRASCEPLIENDPYKDGFLFSNKSIVSNFNSKSVKTNCKKQKIECIPKRELEALTNSYKLSSFYGNLRCRIAYPFTAERIDPVFEMYRLGALQDQSYMPRALTIPFININQKITAIQVKTFDNVNHTIKTNFYHSILKYRYEKQGKSLPIWLDKYIATEKKINCLFGEHLLKDFKTNPVALVESPKTAIYGTLYFGLPKKPTDLIWLSVFNLYSLKIDKCKVLQGRDVILFPDLSKDNKAFKLWTNKAKQFEKELPNTVFKVYDYLEHIASKEEKNKGLDLADFLIQKNWRDFLNDEIDTNVKWEEFDEDTYEEINDENLEDEIQKYFTDHQIEELNSFFEDYKIKQNTIQLNAGERIINLKKMIKTHLDIIKFGNRKPALPYFVRLKKIKQKLTK